MKRVKKAELKFFTDISKFKSWNGLRNSDSKNNLVKLSNKNHEFTYQKRVGTIAPSSPPDYHSEQMFRNRFEEDWRDDKEK